MSLAELQSTVSELEGRIEGQTANIESLKSTISTKDEIITVSMRRILFYVCKNAHVYTKCSYAH